MHGVFQELKTIISWYCCESVNLLEMYLLRGSLHELIFKYGKQGRCALCGTVPQKVQSDYTYNDSIPGFSKHQQIENTFYQR